MENLSKLNINKKEEFQPKDSLQQIVHRVIGVLKDYVEIESLYCFGFKNISSTASGIFLKNPGECDHWNVDLLLISENLPDNCTANLMDLVEKKMEKKLGLSLVCCHPDQIRTSNKDHYYFYLRIIQNAWLIYGKPYEAADFGSDPPELDIEAIKTYTRNRIAISQKNLRLTKLSLDQPLMAASLLHISVEQLCLGMLYSFLIYRPHHFHLIYLLKLCRHFSFLPDRFFLKNLGMTVTMFKILNTTRHELRFRSTDIYSRKDVDLLYQICKDFSASAIPGIEDQLKRLKDEIPKSWKKKK